MPPRSKMRLLPLGALLRQAGCFRQFAVRRPQCGFPPLEERVRERRPLRSTCQRDGLEAAGRDRGTVTVSQGLVSPALSSRGGDGKSPRIKAGGWASRHAGFIQQAGGGGNPKAEIRSPQGRRAVLSLAAIPFGQPI